MQMNSICKTACSWSWAHCCYCVLVPLLQYKNTVNLVKNLQFFRRVFFCWASWSFNFLLLPACLSFSLSWTKLVVPDSSPFESVSLPTNLVYIWARAKADLIHEAGEEGRGGEVLLWLGTFNLHCKDWNKGWGWLILDNGASSARRPQVFAWILVSPLKAQVQDNFQLINTF